MGSLRVWCLCTSPRGAGVVVWVIAITASPPLVVTRCWTTESFPVQKAPEEQPVIGAQRAAPVGPTNTTAFELPFHYYLGFSVRLLLGFATHDNCWGFRTSGLLSIACTRVACPPHNVMNKGCRSFVIPMHSSSHRQSTGKTCEGKILSQLVQLVSGRQTV